MKNRILQAVLRSNLAAFIEKAFKTVDGSQEYCRNWHIEVFADYLEKCMRGEIKRLIISVPPRSLKSLCASVAFPAFLLGHDPSKRIVCVSYSDGLASKLARDCRALMESDFYKQIFPAAKLNPAKRTEAEFETIKNGYRLATSINGTLTGRGGNMIIIDDPLKPQDALSESRRESVNQWYNNTLTSRLDNKHEGCIIIVMQRIHIHDLAAFVQEHEHWEVLNLPSIAIADETFHLSSGKVLGRKKGEALNPSLEDLNYLETTKNKIGGYNFSAQYQQCPIPDSGNIIKWEWFQPYTEIPTGHARPRIIQSWDTAMKTYDGSDYSACVTIKQVDKQYYILDVFRKKLDFPSLQKQIIRQKEHFKAGTVVIEDKGSGTSLLQSLRREHQFSAIAYNPQGSKADRIVAQSATIEAGEVFIPAKATWLDDLRTEIVSFPYGRHDDQIDALSQGLDWAKSRPFWDFKSIL